MKLMLDGLAKDAEAGFWLEGLEQTPQIVRLFPFDFAYLDSDLKIVQSVELPPEAKLPRLHSQTASAIILPLYAFSSTGTVEGDTLLICTEAELELQLGKTGSQQAVIEPVPVPAFDGGTYSKALSSSPANSSPLGSSRANFNPADSSPFQPPPFADPDAESGSQPGDAGALRSSCARDRAHILS